MLAVAMVVSGFSDLYDGRIARRFGVAEAGLRRYDSIADTVFYTGAGIALWMTLPGIVRAHAVLLGAFAIMQVAGHVIDLWKFGRDTSYHTWSGRAFGVMLFIATTIVFWRGMSGGWLAAALVVGMIAHIDAFIITMILPRWTHDVHTVRNALRLRRAAMVERTASTTPP